MTDNITLPRAVGERFLWAAMDLRIPNDDALAVLRAALAKPETVAADAIIDAGKKKHEDKTREEIIITGDAVSDRLTMSRVDFIRLREADRALSAEAEREACAKIADSQIKNLAVLAVKPGKSAAAWDIANAIRARGSKT